MTKAKVENFIVISFIGLIIAIFVGLGGNIVLKAGLPASVAKTEINFEKRLQSLEDDLVSGSITKQEYDSLADILRAQQKRMDEMSEVNRSPEKIPDWVSKLGIIEPDGMRFDQTFSTYTSVDDPTEGFNSISLVYNGTYETAVKEASKIALNAKLTVGGVFKAKGSPVKNQVSAIPAGISYLNYGLENADKDFLISVEVEPSGRMIIMATNNKQLNERLLVYEPLNNRQNSAAKRKKQ